MKKIFPIIILFVLVSAANVMAQDKFANWPALGDFHTVMSATFHPAEKGNFAPVKERSAELATKAVMLSKSIIPESYDQAKLQKVINALASSVYVNFLAFNSSVTIETNSSGN